MASNNDKPDLAGAGPSLDEFPDDDRLESKLDRLRRKRKLRLLLKDCGMGPQKAQEAEDKENVVPKDSPSSPSKSAAAEEEVRQALELFKFEEFTGDDRLEKKLEKLRRKRQTRQLRLEQGLGQQPPPLAPRGTKEGQSQS